MWAGPIIGLYLLWNKNKSTWCILQQPGGSFLIIFFYLYIKKTWYKQCLYVCKCKLLLLLLPCFVPFTECSSPHRPGLRYQDKCQVDFKKVRAEHISDSQLLNLFSARIHQKSVRQPDLDTVQLMPASQIRLRISLKGPTCSLWRWFAKAQVKWCALTLAEK